MKSTHFTSWKTIVLYQMRIFKKKANKKRKKSYYNDIYTIECNNKHRRKKKT